MAKLIKRTWTSRGPTGRRVKRIAWGYTLQVDSKQVRRFDSAWLTRADAEKALSAHVLGLEEEKAKAAAPMTFSEAIEQYLKSKARKKSLPFDKLYLNQVKAAFGADTPRLSAQSVSAVEPVEGVVAVTT